MPHLTDAELKAFEATLNRFEPIRVRDALDIAGKDGLRGDGSSPTASGPLDFGSIPAGVLVYRTESGRVRLRVTITEMTGASYEEFELTDARLATLVRAATELMEHP